MVPKLTMVTLLVVGAVGAGACSSEPVKPSSSEDELGAIEASDDEDGTKGGETPDPSRATNETETGSEDEEEPPPEKGGDPIGEKEPAPPAEAFPRATSQQVVATASVELRTEPGGGAVIEVLAKGAVGTLGDVGNGLVTTKGDWPIYFEANHGWAKRTAFALKVAITPPPPKPAGLGCEPRANSTYCGGSWGVQGDPQTLYRCVDGVRQTVKRCAYACLAYKTSEPDVCAQIETAEACMQNGYTGYCTPSNKAVWWDQGHCNVRNCTETAQQCGLGTDGYMCK